MNNDHEERVNQRKAPYLFGQRIVGERVDVLTYTISHFTKVMDSKLPSFI